MANQTCLARGWRRALVIGVTVLSTAVVIGCGSSDSTESGAESAGSGTSGTAPKMSEVTVGMAPLSQFMMPPGAIDLGYFKQNGLDPQLVSISSTTEEIPKVINGDINFGTGSLSDILPAIQKGAPLKVLSGVGTMVEGNLDTAITVLMTKDPSIKSLKDLAGKSVGVNARGAAAELFTRLELERAGVDPDSVKWARVPFGSVMDALEKGHVDATQVQEPLVTTAEITNPNLHKFHAIGSEVAASLPAIVYFTSKSWAEQHPDEVKAFIVAMQMAAKKFQSDPAAVRDIMKKYTQTPPDVLAKQKNFGSYTTDITPEAMDKEAQLLVTAGAMSSKPSIDDYVYEVGK